MAYFAQRGYPCYTAVLPFAKPPSGNFVASGGYFVAFGVSTSALLSLSRFDLPIDGIVLLAPTPLLLFKLWHAADATPAWVGYGGLQRFARLVAWLRPRLAAAITLHLFPGLGPLLPFQPGWERAAYALRLWLERQQAAQASFSE